MGCTTSAPPPPPPPVRKLGERRPSAKEVKDFLQLKKGEPINEDPLPPPVTVVVDDPSRVYLNIISATYHGVDYAKELQAIATSSQHELHFFGGVRKMLPDPAPGKLLTHEFNQP